MLESRDIPRRTSPGEPALFFERAPVVEPYLRRLRTDGEVTGAWAREVELRERYRSFDGPHTQLIYAVDEHLGLRSDAAMTHPTRSLCLERLCSLFPKGRNVAIARAEIAPMAAEFADIAASYLRAAESAYESAVPAEQRRAHPNRLLRRIVEWMEFPTNTPEREAPEIIVVTNHAGLARNGTRLFETLCRLGRPDAKVFLLGPKEEIGSLVLDLVSSRPNQYPFRTVRERGAWSLEYFVGDYIRRTSFGAVENVVMTYAKESLGRNPFVRFEEHDGQWLCRMHLGKEGWLPAD